MTNWTSEHTHEMQAWSLLVLQDWLVMPVRYVATAAWLCVVHPVEATRYLLRQYINITDWSCFPELVRKKVLPHAVSVE